MAGSRRNNKESNIAKRQEKAVNTMAKKGMKVGKALKKRNDALKDVMKSMR